jgi:hypothetical protein
MKSLKHLSCLFFLIFCTTHVFAQGLAGRWEYTHSLLKFGENAKEIPVLGISIDSEQERPEYIHFYNDKSLETKVIVRHKAKVKFGTYLTIGDGKYVEMTYKDDADVTTIERQQILELNDQTLKLKFKGMIFVYQKVSLK